MTVLILNLLDIQQHLNKSQATCPEVAAAHGKLIAAIAVQIGFPSGLTKEEHDGVVAIFTACQPARDAYVQLCGRRAELCAVRELLGVQRTSTASPCYEELPF